MPLFECQKCHCVENTALSDGYWMNRTEGGPLHCSECATGTWHGRFPKRSAEGMLIDQDGHLWQAAENLPIHYRIVGKVPAPPTEPKE